MIYEENNNYIPHSSESTEKLTEPPTEEATKKELSLNEFMDLCQEKYYDDFFKSTPRVGEYVKVYAIVSDKYEYGSSDMFGILTEDITIKDISEKANVPFSTLNSFLYGDSKDIKLSTAVKLAHALNVSIDELVGTDTINEVSKESIAICRNLPDNAVYLIRWYIRYVDSLNKKNEPHRRYVSAMELECNHNGNLKIATNYRHIDITDISEEYRSKVFFGVTIPCEHYMPTYSPYDILLIANDRNAKINENVLIRTDGNLFIAKRKVENGIVKYYSIRDGKFRLSEDEVDEVIGYIPVVVNSL